MTADSESLITMPLKELIERLDPAMFWQVHRGMIVNINSIKSVRRALAGHLDLRLKERRRPCVSAPRYAHLFKHM